MELFISAYAACFENIPKANSSKAIILSQRFAKLSPKKLGCLNCRRNCIWHINHMKIGTRNTFFAYQHEKWLQFGGLSLLSCFCIAGVGAAVSRGLFAWFIFGFWDIVNDKVFFGDLEGQEFRFQALLLSSGSLLALFWRGSDGNCFQFAKYLSPPWRDEISNVWANCDEAQNKHYLQGDSCHPCGPDQV